MDSANFATDISVKNMWCQRHILVLRQRYEYARQYLNKARMPDMDIGYPGDIHIWGPSQARRSELDPTNGERKDDLQIVRNNQL